jgi:hypothetical protein
MLYYLACDFKNNRPHNIAILSSDGNISELSLLKEKTGVSLYKVFKRIDRIKEILETKKVVLNDFKSYVDAFRLEKNIVFKVHDVGIDTSGSLRKQLKDIVNAYDKKEWQKHYASAQVAYSYLQDRGVYFNKKKVHPTYRMTNTGRSSTSGVNILSATDGDDLYLPGHEYYIHFDWIAADIRMASIMSGDKTLDSHFRKSDPYTVIAEELGGEITKDDVKKEFLPAIYSLNFDNPIFDLIPTFRDWARAQLGKLEDGEAVFSYCGRRFKSDNHKSAFSGMIQGSVAHAMHRCIAEIHDMFAENLLVETHDSVTLMCGKKQIKHIINIVREIMVRPFGDDGPTMPLRVYVGSKFRNWKLYKAYYE